MNTGKDTTQSRLWKPLFCIIFDTDKTNNANGSLISLDHVHATIDMQCFTCDVSRLIRS